MTSTRSGDGLVRPGGAAAGPAGHDANDGTSERPTSRRPGRPAPRTLLALVVALAAVAVYANSLGNGFAYDDVGIIVENGRVHSMSRLPEAVSTPYWPKEHGADLGAWRPLTVAAFALEWAVSDGHPLGFHAVNVALHAVATVLVLLLLAELVPLAGAAVGALLFAVHPVHVEAVANVVGLAELLMAVFVLAACVLYVRSGAGTVRTTIAMSVLYAAACLSKETGIVLPGILLLLDAASGRVGHAGGWFAHARRRLPLFAALAGVAVAVLVLRQLVLGSVASTRPPLGAAEIQSLDRLWTVVSTWPHYLRLMLWPADLSVDYSPEVIPIALGPTPGFLLGLLAGGAVAAAAVVEWRAGALTPAAYSARAVSTGIALFVLAILPVSNVLFLSGVLLAERTLYLPSVGGAFVAGWVAIRVAHRAPRAGAAALAIVVALLSVRTVERNPTWFSTDTVFETLIRDHPESARARWAAGHMFLRAGHLEEGMRAYRSALASIGPHYPLLVEFGRDLIGTEREADAEPYLRQAHELRPDLNPAPHLLTVLLMGRRRYDEAEKAARAALAADSTDAVVHHLLAGMYADQGRTYESIETRRRAIAAGEGGRWQQWYWLAELLICAERIDEAGVALDSAWTRARDPEAEAAIRRLREQPGCSRASPGESPHPLQDARSNSRPGPRLEVHSGGELQ